MHWRKAIVIAIVSSHCLPGKVEAIIGHRVTAADRHSINDILNHLWTFPMHGLSQTTHPHQNESYTTSPLLQV